MDDLTVEYALAPAPGEDPEEKARGLALEQTAELPPTALPEGIDEVWTGRVEAVEPMGEGRYLARIAYRADLAGGELPQLLNLLFGNISLKGGIRVVEVHWPPRLLESLGGPRHGIEGIRAMAGAPEGPLTCTALKPVGSSSVELARLAGSWPGEGCTWSRTTTGSWTRPRPPFTNGCSGAWPRWRRGVAPRAGPPCTRLMSPARGSE